jgi:hypothetical protein
LNGAVPVAGYPFLRDRQLFSNCVLMAVAMVVLMLIVIVTGPED